MSEVKRLRIEPLILAVLGGILLLLSPSSIHLALLHAVHPSPLWEKCSRALTQLGVFYGSALLILAGISLWEARRGTTLAQRVAGYFGSIPRHLAGMVREQLRHEDILSRSAVWLAAALIAGAGLRAYFLALPMKWDESTTFLDNILAPLPYLFRYESPNNHVLNTVLERISIFIWGAHPVSIRLPAYLAGVGSILLIFPLCRALKSGMAGYFALFAAVVWPFLVFYSANGRGYSLVVFLTLALAWAGFAFVQQPTRAGVGLMAVTAALGHLTMPSMLFAVAGIYAWIVCLMLIQGQALRSVLREFVIPCGLLTVALTTILYTPVVLVSGGFEPITSNRLVRSQPWDTFFAEMGPHLGSTVQTLGWGFPSAGLVAFALLVLVGWYAAARCRNWPVLLLLPVSLAAAAAILIAQHRVPYERTWIYLVPLSIVVADAGFAFLLERLPARFRSPTVALLFLGTVFLGVGVIPWYTAASPYIEDFQEAPVAARFLQPLLSAGDAVRTSLAAEPPTFFYLWYYNGVVDPATGDVIQPEIKFHIGQGGHYSFLWYGSKANRRLQGTAEPRRVFFVLKKSECTTGDSSVIDVHVGLGEELRLPVDRVRKLLDYADMAIYQSIGPGDPSLAPEKKTTRAPRSPTKSHRRS